MLNRIAWPKAWGFALVFLASGGATLAATFTTIDVPGAPGTIATAINPQGAVLVHFGDGTAGSGMLEGGWVTNVNVPGSISTVPRGITIGSWRPIFAGDADAIVGDYTDAQNKVHGFMLFKPGSYQTFDVPGASTTAVFAMSPTGDLVGQFTDNTGIHGFLMSGGQLTRIDGPGSIHTEANGINAVGDITGFYHDASNVQHGFLRKRNGTFSTLDFPSASGTVALGIGPQGDIVGYYGQPLVNQHGFLLHNGVYSTVDFPGATATAVYSINPDGSLVGAYQDATKLHGFVMNP